MDSTTALPGLCPICGNANACAIVADGEATAPCWCRSLQIGQDVLDRIPADARGVACVCEACVRSAT